MDREVSSLNEGLNYRAQVKLHSTWEEHEGNITHNCTSNHWVFYQCRGNWLSCCCCSLQQVIVWFHRARAPPGVCSAAESQLSSVWFICVNSRFICLITVLSLQCFICAMLLLKNNNEPSASVEAKPATVPFNTLQCGTVPLITPGVFISRSKVQ